MAPIYNITDNTIDPLLFSGASCAFGVFDGVHKGHQFLIDETIKTARESNGRSIVVTFDIDPDEKFHPENLKKIMSNKQRLEALASSGVDCVVVIPFTDEFAALTPQEFLTRMFTAARPAFVHIGKNIRFGVNGSGSIDDMKNWACCFVTRIYIHDLQTEDGQTISATHIRNLLEQGNIEEAEELLGHAYVEEGIVLKGRGEGRKIGFPTANLKFPYASRLLPSGVYAAKVELEGKNYKAAVSLGTPPTFDEDSKESCEVHILDFDGDLYGKTIQVEFISFLRSMKKFDNFEQLAQAVQSDVEWVEKNL